MALKSYLKNKELNFSDISVLPIHLGDLGDRRYFAFAESNDPPSGGKTVTEDEIASLRINALTFKQIKQKAEERILAIAPLWRQQNALADLLLLGEKENPTGEELSQINQAKELLEAIQAIRNRSNDIEMSILNGIAVDYLTDYGWNGSHAE